MSRGWRPAAAIIRLVQQIDALYPNRSRKSDGIIGDTDHATRDSDHNPWIIDSNRIGVVTAVDITDEAATGCDGEDLAALLRASRDPRIKYLIFNSRICRSYAKPGIAPWEWAPYTGTNAHKHHVHVSVRELPGHYDSTVDWKIRAC